MKRQSNIKKHGVDFADVTNIFYEESTFMLEDTRNYEERRFIALGVNVLNSLVVVVHAYRDEDTIRIISARHANNKESEQFYRYQYAR